MEQNRKVRFMKKKILILLSLVLLLLLTACEKDPKKMDYNGVSYSELEETHISIIESSAEFTEEQYVLYEQNKESYKELEYQFVFVRNWLDIEKEYGEYQGYYEDTMSVSKAGETLTTNMQVSFEEKDATVQLVYNYHTMELTGITIEPNYTLKEKLSTAGMNTLISMSIVFLVLILISLIIYCFKIIPYIQNRKKNKQDSNKSKEFETSVVEQIQKREEQENDTELVAVIAAAIASYENKSTNDFVVRTIRRR